jgi:hypothetical protein
MANRVLAARKSGQARLALTRQSSAAGIKAAASTRRLNLKDNGWQALPYAPLPWRAHGGAGVSAAAMAYLGVAANRRWAK